MALLLRINLVFLLLLGIVLSARPAVAEVPIVEFRAAEAEILNLQQYQIWQRINQARRNPRAVMERLWLDEQRVRAVLGDDQWILDQGLPPLAWSDLLYLAADSHGRDMVTQVYYSHYSPQGLGPARRIAATGYQAVREDETLGALLFKNFVPLDFAVDFMLDNIYRDELLGTPGVRRNIFSNRMTEVGMTLLAENLKLLEGQPYVYLMVLDFAAPLEPRRFLIGALDPGSRPAGKNYLDYAWRFLPQLPGDAFQVPLPAGGMEVLAVEEGGRGSIGRTVIVPDDQTNRNRFVDLRTAR